MKKILFYSTIYFILYYIFVLTHTTLIGFIGSNIWGMIGSIVAIYYLGRNINRLKDKVFWSLIFISIIFKFIAEAVWAYRELVLQIAPSNGFVELCYVFMAMIITTAIIYKLLRFKKLEGVLKTAIWSLPEILGFIYITYLLFFKGLTLNLSQASIAEWSKFIFLLSDLVILLIMIIFFVENHSEIMRTRGIILQALGILIYTIIDLIYIYKYQKIYVNYYSGNFMAPLWSMGVGLIILSAFYEVNNHNADDEISFDLILLNNQVEIKFILNIVGIGILLLISKRNVPDKEKIGMTIFLLISYIIFAQIGGFFKKHNLEQLNNALLSKVKEIHKLNTELISKNEQLQSIAYLDALTSLGNRRYIEREINKTITLVDKKDMDGFAIVLIDLNRFKSINDWYGHDIGDKLIIEVGKKLKNSVSEDVAVTRQGGDEFMLLIPNISKDSCVKNIMDRVVDEFKEPILLDGNDFIANLSIGIARYPIDGGDQRSLIKNADLAMYRSKGKGDNKIVFYHKEYGLSALRKIRIEHLLKHINFNDEFSIYYQPQIDISNGERLIGFEALIRWKSKELGFVSPIEFIDIADETGTIFEISKWVLENAIKQIALWNKRYNISIKIGINIAPKYFIAKYFIDEIDRVILENNINPSCVDLEITEEVSMKNQKVAKVVIQNLRERGYKISIDDFGTGYSSFSYLSNLHFDTLKIAMPFVKGIHKKEQDFQIVKAIINMAKILNMKVIAEGVEEKEQLDKLKDLGCDEVQGYYFSKPLPAHEAEEFIQNCANGNSIKL